jgi:hypothetical protein
MGNSDISNVRLTATAGFTLKGRIISEGMSQQVVSANSARVVNLAPQLSSMPLTFAMISPDGSFVFQSVFPGDYQVTSPGVLDGSNGFINCPPRRTGSFAGWPPHSRSAGWRTHHCGFDGNWKLQGRILNGRREPAANATIVICRSRRFATGRTSS